MNNFKIYTSDPYTFKIKISSENNFIKYNITSMNAIIKNCKESQIKIIKKNYFYCEDPECFDDCPIKEGHAICLKSSNENKNSKFLNECHCIPGWTGTNCSDKDHPDVKK